MNATETADPRSVRIVLLLFVLSAVSSGLVSLTARCGTATPPPAVPSAPQEPSPDPPA